MRKISSCLHVNCSLKKCVFQVLSLKFTAFEFKYVTSLMVCSYKNISTFELPSDVLQRHQYDFTCKVYSFYV